MTTMGDDAVARLREACRSALGGVTDNFVVGTLAMHWWVRVAARYRQLFKTSIYDTDRAGD